MLYWLSELNASDCVPVLIDDEFRTIGIGSHETKCTELPLQKVQHEFCH